MKNRLCMRLASLALCVVFTGMLFGVPKAKAVATETAVATAAIGAYMNSTGLIMTAKGLTGAALSEFLLGQCAAHVAAMEAAATPVAASTSGFLSSIAAGCSISPAGMLVIGAGAVLLIGGLVAWYIHENALEEEGKTAIFSFESAYYLEDGTQLIFVDPSVGILADEDATFFVANVDYSLTNGYHIMFSSPGAGYLSCIVTSPSGTSESVAIGGNLWASYTFDGGKLTYESECYVTPAVHWYSSTKDSWLTKNTSFYIGEPVSSDLTVTRGDEFTQPDQTIDSEALEQMVIDVGLSSGATLDDVATTVPEQLAANTANYTYEITVNEAGEGSGDPDTGTNTETTGLLQSILTAIGGVAGTAVSGIQSLFTPSQSAIDGLSAQIDDKLPFIPTLQNFGDTLVYNLEHPEHCADGLGLTTVVDLGKGRGTYLGNTQHDIFNVSWYLEYKPLVDDIIVGFCWLCFLWNCYGALPRIIHGEGTVDKVATILQQKFDGDGD